MKFQTSDLGHFNNNTRILLNSKCKCANVKEQGEVQLDNRINNVDSNLFNWIWRSKKLKLYMIYRSTSEAFDWPHNEGSSRKNDNLNQCWEWIGEMKDQDFIEVMMPTSISISNPSLNSRERLRKIVKSTARSSTQDWLALVIKSFLTPK